MKKVNRLIEQFQPSNYQLTLSISKSDMQFSGQVTIAGHKSTKAEHLTLHSKDLKIQKATIDEEQSEFKIDEDSDELIIVDSNKEAGKRIVRIEFSGTITDSMVGIYPCNFTHDGKDKKLIATQFESHHAREVFPCIDEPAAKAVFELSLETDESDATVSNTEISSTEKSDNDRKAVHFKPTPVMSTYLLAFVVGDIKYQEAKSKNNVRVRIWATPDNYKNTDFALEVAVKALDFYEDYFGVKYPLDKCDHIALPDFAAGAMENWGCITYREAGLIADEHTSMVDKQWVALVIAHELAHQWFGNLVTMAWWNDLWLNEGFASWIEYLALDTLFPEWKMWEQFTTSDLIAAQKLDSLENTHPIEVELNDPDEIRDIFDAISYQKGACVIRMLHEFIGADYFQKGLNKYLTDNSYKNTVTNDLWESLESVSGKPVSEFMSQWTTQPGFPFLSIEDEGGEKLNISQKRFYADGREDATATWPVPIYSQSKDAVVFKAANGTVKKSEKVLNTHQGSFFMTSYPDEMIDELTFKIKDGQLTAVERLGALNDTFEIAKAGYGSIGSALKLLTAYGNETSAVTWDIIAMQLSSIRKVMSSKEVSDAQKPFILDLTSRLYNDLGWVAKKDEDYFDKLLRPMILAMASFAENEDARATALSKFSELKKVTDLEPDLRPVVYNTASRNGGQSEFDKLLELYKNTVSAQERTNLVSALTNFEQDYLHDQVLALIKTDAVRLQEVSYWLAYSFRNSYSRQATWEWLKDNWGWVENKFGTDIMTYSRFPKYAAGCFSSDEFLSDYLAFFKSIDTKGIQRSIDQGAETIKWQAKWRQRDYDTILKFFKSQQN